MKNPRGWEIGTLDIHLHEEGRRDPLFHGLPATIRVNLTHEDMVCHETLPRERIRILAANPKTEVQALAVGDKIRGIQFHPEVTGAVCHAYLQARRHLLAGQDVDELLRAAADCPDGTQVISNFRHFFVEGAAGPQMV